MRGAPRTHRPPSHFSIFHTHYEGFGSIWFEIYMEAWNLPCGRFGMRRFVLYVFSTPKRVPLRGWVIFPGTWVIFPGTPIWWFFFWKYQVCSMVFKIRSGGFQVSGLWLWTWKATLASWESTSRFLWKTSNWSIDLWNKSQDSFGYQDREFHCDKSLSWSSDAKERSSFYFQEQWSNSIFHNNRLVDPRSPRFY